MRTPAQYAAATEKVMELGGQLIAERVPRMFQEQAREALDSIAPQVARAAVDAADGAA